MSYHNLGAPTPPYYPTAPYYPASAGIAGVQAAANAQAQAQAMQPQAQLPVGIFQQARAEIDACHQMLSDLHKFADQYVGIRGEEPAQGPSVVPNGQAEELRHAAMSLQQRLRLLCDRLSVL